MKGKITYDKEGKEIHNGSPVRMPVGFHRPSPLADTINRLVDRRLAEGGASEADETYAEAQDFDCGGDDAPPPGKGWEIGDEQSDSTMHPETPKPVNKPPEDGVRNTSAKGKVSEDLSEVKPKGAAASGTEGALPEKANETPST